MTLTNCRISFPMQQKLGISMKVQRRHFLEVDPLFKGTVTVISKGTDS